MWRLQQSSDGSYEVVCVAESLLEHEPRLLEVLSPVHARASKCLHSLPRQRISQAPAQHNSTAAYPEGAEREGAFLLSGEAVCTTQA